ncbi:MAG: PEPxxWA-CTERM sorting domain-containing protein [Sphingomonadaceae bacterium]|nr:PEPxxWA-CTERM sorting domain-containing protein [Sphingomonadaceae bacterium]
MAGVTVNAGVVKLFSATDNVEGAIPAFGPANCAPGSLSFLSVLGGASASITFAPAKAISFDLGSLDFYNSLTLNFAGGGSQAFQGGEIIGLEGTAVLSNGDRFSPLTNGRVTFTGAGSERIAGITLASSTNSFEIDRLAAAIPEPAGWALLIIGFAFAGSALRRRGDVPVVLA